MGETEVYRAVFDADADDLINESNRAQASLTKLTKQFDQVGRKMVKWGAVAGTAIGGVVAQAIRAASTIEEMQNRTMVTFRASAKVVQDWSREYSEAIGRSRFAMEGLATEIGVLLSAFGFSREEVAKNAIALGKLTSDWESFMDIPASAVLSKVASGLAGEAEALRRVGVDVSAAAVGQELLNQGWTEGIDAASQLTKVKARLAIILRGLPDALDDAEKTALSLSNQWRAMLGALEELNVSIGQAFADSAKTAIGAMVGLIKSAAKWVEQNKTFVKAAGIAGLKTSAWAVAIGAAGIGLSRSIQAIRAAMRGLRSFRNTVIRVLSSMNGLNAAVKTLSLKMTVGKAGLVLAAGAAGYALGRLIGRATGLDKALAELFISWSRTSGAISDANAIIDEVSVSMQPLNKNLKTSREEQKKLEEAAKSGEITWDKYKSTIDAVASKVMSADEAIAATEETTRDLTAELKNTSEELDRIATKLSNSIEYLNEMRGAQQTLKQATFEATQALAEESPEKALKEYLNLEQQINELWPEIGTGSVKAVSEMTSLISEIPGLDIEGLATAWTNEAIEAAKKTARAAGKELKDIPEVSVEEARKRLTEFIEEASQTTSELAEMHEDITEKIVKGLEERIKEIDSGITSIQDNLARLEMTIDTTGALAAIEKVKEKLGELPIKPGGFLSPTLPEGAGPGLGTPTLDRLSTAMSTQRGRSGGNVVNVNAPVSIRHAEPPRATAKLVAQEIRRSARRTWGGRS